MIKRFIQWAMRHIRRQPYRHIATGRCTVQLRVGGTQAICLTHKARVY